MKKKLIAVLVSVLATFVLLEIGGRVWLTWFADESAFSRYAPPTWVPEELQLYHPHPYTAYTLNPAYRSKNGLNRHNSIGYRGDDFSRQKPAGTYRILLLGGSTTYETGVSDYHQTTPVILETLLREKRGTHDVEVINAGCPGWNSWESLVDLEFRGLALDPDLVVVYCGTNDVHVRLVPPERYQGDNTGFRTSWIPDWSWWERSVALRRIGILVHAAKKNSVSGMTEIDYNGLDEEAALTANPPRYYEQNLENMIAVSKHHGANVMVASWAWCGEFEGDYASRASYQRGFRETNDVSRRVAEKNGVPFFDYAAVMPADKKYWHDGRHVSAEGARVKAELFAAFIAEHAIAER